jgi:hypothetical protein
MPGAQPAVSKTAATVRSIAEREQAEQLERAKKRTPDL